MQIYNEVVRLGIPHSNHYSDLYIPSTDETRQLLKDCGITTARPFVNKVEGGIWFDVPFAYLPFWDKKAKATGNG